MIRSIGRQSEEHRDGIHRGSFKLVVAGIVSLIAAIGVFCELRGADDVFPASASSPRLDFSVLDSAGVPHSLRINPERAGQVIVFLSTECPIARGYLPEASIASLRHWKRRNSGSRFSG